MDKLHVARNLFDFGIVIVVWLAQVIMYPSLAHIERDAFVSWHRKYSSRIAFFVIPLLCGQAIIVGILVCYDASFLSVLSAALISFCWVSTFGLSVPCHAKLQRSGKDISVIRRLVWTNLIRTILWSLVFLIGIWSTLFSESNALGQAGRI
jgi:hypothetical protein